MQKKKAPTLFAMNGPSYSTEIGKAFGSN